MHMLCYSSILLWAHPCYCSPRPTYWSLFRICPTCRSVRHGAHLSCKLRPSHCHLFYCVLVVVLPIVMQSSWRQKPLEYPTQAVSWGEQCCWCNACTCLRSCQDTVATSIVSPRSYLTFFCVRDVQCPRPDVSATAVASSSMFQRLNLLILLYQRSTLIRKTKKPMPMHEGEGTGGGGGVGKNDPGPLVLFPPQHWPWEISLLIRYSDTFSPSSPWMTGPSK
jgi:hypothetical protein